MMLSEDTFFPKMRRRLCLNCGVRFAMPENVPKRRHFFELLNLHNNDKFRTCTVTIKKHLEFLHLIQLDSFISNGSSISMIQTVRFIVDTLYKHVKLFCKIVWLAVLTFAVKMLVSSSYLIRLVAMVIRV